MLGSSILSPLAPTDRSGVRLRAPPVVVLSVLRMKIFVLVPLEFKKTCKKVVDYLKKHNFNEQKPPKFRRITFFHVIVWFVFSSWRERGYNIFFEIMRLTKNFELEEFACKDGTPVPKKFYDNCKELAENLQVLRDSLGIPLVVLSGYRTAKHNKKIGGASASFHLTASAADIKASSIPTDKIYMRILELMEEGKMKKGGLKCYSTWVHYDIRGTVVLF